MALRYLPVRYEDMVTDQEATVRAVLEFIGEPFDPKCLAFHQNQRYARTASYAQVTERLYDRSRFRYRHYRRHLEPVIPVLRPILNVWVIGSSNEMDLEPAALGFRWIGGWRSVDGPDGGGRRRAADLMVPVPMNELFTIAARQERAGNLVEADRLLGHILAVAPDQPDALHMSGIVAFRLGRQDEALAKMEQAIAHGVDVALYLRNICEVYRTLNRLDEAVAAGKRAVALAPSDPLCWHNLAVIHYERVEIDESLDCAERALMIDPIWRVRISPAPRLC